MKLRTLSIFAAAAIVSLTACGGDDAAETGDDTTGVAVDSPMAVPPAPITPDTTMAPLPAPATGDTVTGDTVTGDTTP